MAEAPVTSPGEAARYIGAEFGLRKLASDLVGLAETSFASIKMTMPTLSSAGFRISKGI